MLKKVRKPLSIILACLMALTLLAACGGNNADKNAKTDGSTAAAGGSTQEAKTEDLPWMTYSFYFTQGETDSWADIKTDVVSPYIFEKFKIKVGDVVTAGGQSADERLTTLAASDSLPDVIQIKPSVQASTLKKLADAGYLTDLSPYVSPEKTPNVYQYIVDGYDAVKQVKSYSAKGELLGFPQISPTGAIPKVKESKYTPYPVLPWTIMIRSDILRQLGYNFKKYSELKAEFGSNQRPLTADDLKVEPAINTPDDFYNLLKKIKELNLKVGDKNVIPLSIPNWQLYHLGSLFGTCLWTNDPNGEINGFMGHQYAKDYWKYVRKLYKEGLLDPDFSIQKDEQFIQKGASGQIATTIFYSPGNYQIIDGIVKTNPDYEWVRIPMPHLADVKPYTDEQVPAEVIYSVNKKVKDPERLIKYWDWFYSDEAFDILTWGPESAGLYEVKDGKKVYKDPQLWDLIKNGVQKQKGYDYYGLLSPNTAVSDRPGAIAAVAAPLLRFFNPMDARNSYPYETDFYNESQIILGSFTAATDGSSSMGDGSDAANASQNFFWNDLLMQSAEMYTADTDAKFEAAWDKIYKQFLDKGKYEEAKKVMTEFLTNRNK